MAKAQKTSTIKVKDTTKKRLINLDFVKKGMSFDEIINQVLDNIKKRG